MSEKPSFKFVLQYFNGEKAIICSNTYDYFKLAYLFQGK